MLAKHLLSGWVASFTHKIPALFQHFSRQIFQNSSTFNRARFHDYLKDIS